MSRRNSLTSWRSNVFSSKASAAVVVEEFATFGGAAVVISSAGFAAGGGARGVCGTLSRVEGGRAECGRDASCTLALVANCEIKFAVAGDTPADSAGTLRFTSPTHRPAKLYESTRRGEDIRDRSDADLFTDVHFKVDTLDSICMQMSC
jgi:hypothetical protein